MRGAWGSTAPTVSILSQGSRCHTSPRTHSASFTSKAGRRQATLISSSLRCAFVGESVARAYG